MINQHHRLLNGKNKSSCPKELVGSCPKIPTIPQLQNNLLTSMQAESSISPRFPLHPRLGPSPQPSGSLQLYHHAFDLSSQPGPFPSPSKAAPPPTSFSMSSSARGRFDSDAGWPGSGRYNSTVGTHPRQGQGLQPLPGVLQRPKTRPPLQSPPSLPLGTAPAEAEVRLFRRKTQRKP